MKMYKHKATNIKETTDKQFVSLEEKNKIAELNTAMNEFNDDINNQFENVNNRLNDINENFDRTMIELEGTHISSNDTVEGFITDIEIFGNTIQNSNNLSDIKSVGELQEDGTYKMILKSCGKNLFNDELEMGLLETIDKNMLGKPKPSDIYCRSKNFIQVDENMKLSLSLNKPLDGANMVLFYYDNMYEYNGYEVVYNTLKGTFTTKPNTKYLKVRLMTTDLDIQVQLNEGGLCDYEEYQDSISEINLPIPLEKVGNVSDRLYFDDNENAWCVEKNIIEDIITPVYFGPSKEGEKTKTFIYNDITRFKPTSNTNIGVISNRFNSLDADTQWVNDTESISINVDGALVVKISKDKLESLESEGFYNWLKSNKLVIKKHNVEPLKIILPLDIQIQLNSFFGSTHVFMEAGDVEGTIKVKVPKNLGGTVNSLVKTTNNLSTRVEVIEGLKESQNMNYSTDKGFIVCENTNNGVVDNLKLEGKTLNQLFRLDKFAVINDTFLYAVSSDTSYSNITSGKTFTIINNSSRIITLDIHENEKWKVSIGIKPYQQKIITTSVSEYVKYIYGSDIHGWDKDSDVHKTELKNSCLLLEGDWVGKETPLEYFEGIKSVGVDVDNIGIISRKEDKNLFDDTNFNFTSEPYAESEFYPIRLIDKKIAYGLYTEDGNIYRNTDMGFRLCNINKKEIMWKAFNSFPENSLNVICDRFNEVRYIQVYCNGNMTDVQTFDKLMITNNNAYIPTEYIPHISDKKQLQYYNSLGELVPVTQLRGLPNGIKDTVEKHTDGKWYYHKRCGEIVLNGSEDWKLYDSTGVNTIRFYTTINGISTNSDLYVEGVSDRFNRTKAITGDTEGLHLWGVSRNTNIRILRSKLESLDPSGFKQWLQNNPTTIVYQLENEEVYECVPLHLDSYDGETTVICNAGVIQPTLEFSISTHINNLISSNKERIRLLEEEIYSSQEVQNNIIMDRDLRLLNLEIMLMSIVSEEKLRTIMGQNKLTSGQYYKFIENLIERNVYPNEFIVSVLNLYLQNERIDEDEYNTLTSIIENKING